LLDAFFLPSTVCQLKLLGLVMSEITDKLAMVITITCVGVYAFFSTGGPLPRITTNSEKVVDSTTP
jgi:hypothetical protein